MQGSGCVNIIPGTRRKRSKIPIITNDGGASRKQYAIQHIASNESLWETTAVARNATQANIATAVALPAVDDDFGVGSVIKQNRTSNEAGAVLWEQRRARGGEVDTKCDSQHLGVLWPAGASEK